MSDIKQLKEQLVVGCRALGTEEWVKGYGHLSVRIPGKDLFLMPRISVLSETTDEDIWTFNLRGEKVEGGKGDIPSEIPIHCSVYRARPDVSSVCHVHPPNVVLLTLVGETIRPLTMSSISYPRGVPVFKRLGLIITDELGDGMVKAMGKEKVVILRAHGAVVTGKDIVDCVTGMVALEEMASTQIKAMMLGKPHYFTSEEIGEIKETFKIMEQKGLTRQMRSWDYLFRKIKK